MNNRDTDRGFTQLAQIAPGLLERLQAAAQHPAEPLPPFPPKVSEPPHCNDTPAVQDRLSKKRRKVIGRKFYGEWFRSHNALIDRWLRVIGMDAFVVYQVFSREARGETPDLVMHLS